MLFSFSFSASNALLLVNDNSVAFVEAQHLDSLMSVA